MNPNQQPLINQPLPSPYRHNYHINPAQSKIIYKNPQNIHQLPSPNSINLMHIQNPQNTPMQYINSAPQYHQGQIPMPSQVVYHQQARSRSLSPVGGFAPQNIHPNQRVLVQSPPPYPQYHGTQHPHLIQGQQLQKNYSGPQLMNPSLQVLVQGTLPPPAQNLVHYLHQNDIQVKNDQRAKSPSVGTTPIGYVNPSNHSGINFSYQNQLRGQPGPNQPIIQSHTIGQNPILANLSNALQKNIVVSQEKSSVLQSAININLNSTGPHKIQQSAATFNMNSMQAQNPKSSNIQNSENQQISVSAPQKTQSIQQKSQPMFSITQSYATHQPQSQQIHNSVRSPQQGQVPPSLGQMPPQIHETSQNYTQNAQQISSNPIWEQRFIMIYQKFQWFYERYDFISREFQILSQQFENVNSEDEWLELKEKHDLLLEKIQQIQEELVNTIHENQQLAQQYELQNRNSKESDEVQRVWEHRYHELLEEYKSLSQNYADLQSQGNNQNTSQSQHSQNRGGMSIEQQAEMQGKFHELQNEYNVLCEEYEKIRIEYERIYEENTQYSKQNNDLIASQQQARNMAAQLQGYVEELQQQNDQLRKQQRKSAPSQENYIPREQFQKMQYHFGEQIQKYEDQLQKYRMALEQYEQRTEMNRQQLQKISQIAMERQNRIRQLEQYQNSNSKSGHSNNNIAQNENHDLERRYVNILEQDVKLWREKETDFLHKLELKDMERRSLQEKIHYLEKQLDTKKMQLERLSKNLNDKLSKIEQNTSSHITGASRHIIEQQVVRPLGSTQYQAQIHDLQNQLHELQNILNSKMSTYRELQQSIMNYESQLRKQSSAQTTTEIQFQRKISQLEIDTNKKLAEKDMRITVLNSQIQRLKDACDHLNKQKQSIKQSLRVEFIENEKQLIQRHNSRVTETEKKLQEKSGEAALLKEILQKYEKQLKMKNDELMELRNFVSQMKKSNSSSNIVPSRNDYQLVKQELKLKDELLERRNEQLNKIKREKEYKIKQISELQHQLEEVNSQLSKRRSEVSSLKRQLSDLQGLQSEFETVKSSLNKKTLEINQLKQELFEIEKLRMENDSQRRDLQRATNDNKQKYKEIQKLKEQNYELERKLAFSKTTQSAANNITSNSRYQGGNDDSEVFELRELIRKKDSQISRINQSLQQTQYTLQNRSRELQIHKSQLSALTKSKQSEVSSLTHNISSLESRLKDSDTKRAKLVEETNELRNKFEEQLKAQSQRQKAYYEKVIARHEDDYKGLKQKLRASEEVCNKMEMDLEKSRTSEKNLQIELSEINKKLLSYQSQTLQKEELFSTFRQKQVQSEQSTKALYEKLSALELQLKTKEQQMKLSEQKNAILQQKIKKTKKDHQTFKNKLIVSQQYQNNNSVVEYLSKRIAQYESKMINQSEKDFGFKVKDQQANHVFQNQVVYHLKMQNQMLRRQLQGKGIQYDRKVLNQLQEQNLKRSKNLLRNSAFSSKLGNISSNLLIKDNIDDVNFYKQKNKQLQERVQKHLKCNRQLKDKIQLLIKGSQNKQTQYYKEQISEYEHKITQLEKRVQALTEQNKNINKGMSKRQSRVEEHYEDRVKELEVRISQMTKTIQQLSQQKNDLEITKSELQMQKVTLNDEIKRLNEKISTLQSSKNQKYEQQVIQLRQRCENYESEITKISNRARILQQQIKRLNETSNASKLSMNELNSLKLKIQELTNLLTKAERELHEEQARSNSLSNEIASLQLKCRTWQSETQRLKEMNELYAKKQRNDLSESTVLKQSSTGLQSQISSLQSQLSSISHQKHELQIRIASIIQQLRYYESLIPSLIYDLEFIRSDTLVQETLIEEMVIGGDNTAECIDGLRVNVQRKMYWLDQLFNKVRKL